MPIAVKELGNPVVLVGGVALTTWCSAARVNYGFVSKPDGAFGQTFMTNRAGLQDNSASLTVYMSYAAAASYSILKALVGTKVTLKVNPAAGADSALNPGFTLTETFFAQLPVMDAKFGDLISVDLEFLGGEYTEDVTV